MRLEETYRVDASEHDVLIIHFDYASDLGPGWGHEGDERIIRRSQRMYFDKANLPWLVEAMERQLEADIDLKLKYSAGYDSFMIFEVGEHRLISIGSDRPQHAPHGDYNVHDGVSVSGFYMTRATAQRMVTDLAALLPDPVDGRPRPAPLGPPSAARMATLWPQLPAALQQFPVVSGGRYDEGVRLVRRADEPHRVVSLADIKLEVGRQATPETVHFDAALAEAAGNARAATVAVKTFEAWLEAQLRAELGDAPYEATKWQMLKGEAVTVSPAATHLFAVATRATALRQQCFTMLQHLVESRRTPAQAQAELAGWQAALAQLAAEV